MDHAMTHELKKAVAYLLDKLEEGKAPLHAHAELAHAVLTHMRKIENEGPTLDSLLRFMQETEELACEALARVAREALWREWLGLFGECVLEYAAEADHAKTDPTELAGGDAPQVVIPANDPLPEGSR